MESYWSISHYSSLFWWLAISDWSDSMKKRSGLVSNSSTSSFILIGYPKPDLDIDIFLRALGLDPDEMKDYEKEDYFYDSHDECDCMRGEFIGKLLAYWSDEEGLDAKSVDIMEMFMKARDIGEKLGIKEDPKLFFGTVSC